MIAGKPLILVVDDDVQVAAFTSLLLQRAGFGVVTATSGEEALAVWKEGFDLLLTDYTMPGLLGDQLAFRLLERNPALKVILMSGNTMESFHGKIAVDQGRNFLQKPFMSDELLRIVSTALEDATDNNLTAKEDGQQTAPASTLG